VCGKMKRRAFGITEADIERMDSFRRMEPQKEKNEIMKGSRNKIVQYDLPYRESAPSLCSS
jgi:hypothetical protein